MTRSTRLALAALLVAACGDDSASVSDASTGSPDDAASAADADLGLGLTATPVVSDLQRPLLVTAPADDSRLFVIEKRGRIRIISDGEVAAEDFLDIRSSVESGGSEQGLLGLAFHPDYAESGRFFVNYSDASGEGATVIAEYQVSEDPGLADPIESRLLVIPQNPDGVVRPNHNGGMIAFGPDGYLYIGMGDGGGGGDPGSHGQNRSTLLGAMLRIDVDGDAPYAIPEGNPFADGQAGAPEVWAIGLRNPWRWSFDRQTGDMIIGDVGQGDREEISFAPAGAGGLNFGWNIREGSRCYPPSIETCVTENITEPIFDYQQEGDRCAVVGGYVYRGAQLPDFVGWYFFADYCTGEVLALESPGTPTTEAIAVGLDVGERISSFGEGSDGELYLAGRGGTIYRLTEQ